MVYMTENKQDIRLTHGLVCRCAAVDRPTRLCMRLNVKSSEHKADVSGSVRNVLASQFSDRTHVIRRRLHLRFDFDSTAIRMQFDHAAAIRRPTLRPGCGTVV